MTWIKKLNIERAIKEIQYDERRSKDFCLDPLRFEDLSLKNVKQKLISTILSDLENNKFSVDKLITIDVPKTNYILRPGARPNLINWIVYTAITNFISDTIYKKIPKNSYSFNKFRYKKNKNKKPIDYWVDFENDSIKLSEDDKFKYLLTTDIASFFEHISIEELESRLKVLSTDKDYVKAVNYLVNNILLKWTENNKISKFGLPQGPTASTLLADIYLYAVDKSLNDKKNIKFLRYMDDFKLFAKNKIELKKSISSLVIDLRNLKLNLNAKKTSIFSLKDREKLKNVFDPNRDILNLIDTAFRSKKKDQILLVIPYLPKLKDSSHPIFNERYFKFFIGKIIDLMKLNLIGKIYIENLTKEFLTLFREKHHLSNIFSWFFVASGNYSKKSKEYIKDELIIFICSKENIYEWQEMWALDTIRQLGKVNKTQLTKLEKKYSKNNNLCFSQFALIAGMSGNHDTREKLLNLKKTDFDQYRSTCLAVQELHKDIFKKAKLKMPEYYQLYLNTIKKAKYGFQYTLEYDNLDISGTEQEYY